MTGVYAAVFKAIHEGKWLTIEYRNRNEQTTRYWIAIRELRLPRGVLVVDGLHLGQLTVQELSIYLDRIRSAELVEGSWCPVNEALVADIEENPNRYAVFFSSPVNLRVLDYLAACNRLDSVPYKTDYALIRRLDGDSFSGGRLPLNDAQFREIVENFQQRTQGPAGRNLHIQQLGLNLISVDTPKGLYVLAYRPLVLDVKKRELRAQDEIVLCREFTIQGDKVSLRKFLDPEDYALLDRPEQNLERIKDRITANNPQLRGVNDMPYLVAIGRDVHVDLDYEYRGILDLYDSDREDGKSGPTPPIRAFFGEMTTRPRRRKSFPLALLNRRINLDQLLAINSAMRYPLTYVQGPPGTGKTNTIVNTLVTAFFNERTVLFASYNNHPIDGVVEKLQNLTYRGRTIPFPILRLGNSERTAAALDTIRRLYDQCRKLKVYEKALDRNHAQRAERARQLTALLERYEKILDLREREATIHRLLEARSHLNFQYELQGAQLPALQKELAKLGTVTTEDALALLDRNEEELYQYLNFTSARYILRLREPKYEDLMEIVNSPEEPQDKVIAFNRYLSEPENLKKLLRVFPIIATTCISAHRLGKPEPVFDMVIMDEASQCNTAMSLVPILRGNSLMLVGDPQQLSPVIVLDPKDNETLRRRYRVTQEYDYIANSIYKCFLACDAISDEVLLSWHYRCHPRIIQFNNKKYYNNKLHVASKVESDKPLVYVEIPNDTTDEKNTAPAEVDMIRRYLDKYPERSVGIITPFARQRECIEDLLKVRGYANASCGTVHAFQGDEKDVVIFSLAVTDRTRPETYKWLKDNKELINVATSRAREQLVVLSNQAQLDRLHAGQAGSDDLYELVQYVKSHGTSRVTAKPAASRALGIKPYSTKTEDAFLENLNHALDNAFLDGRRCTVRREVAISQVFVDNPSCVDLFYTGRFDFVVYERQGGRLMPILAIELDGKEHRGDPAVQARDRKKEAICREHGFELIRVENSYARRYHYIKEILIRYFGGR